MPKTLALALILAVSASPMTVAAVGADQGAAQTPAKKAKPKKICKAGDRVTGSRVAKRTCKTEEEWAKAAANDKETKVKSQN